MARTRLSDPRPADKRYVQRILRYLAGHLDYGIRYTLDPPSDQPDPQQLKVYVDSSFAAEGDTLEPEFKTASRSADLGAL